MTRAAGASLAALLAASLAACGGAAWRAPAGSAELSPIAQMHRSRCGACHVPVMPGEKPRAVVEAAMKRHRSRVHLREEQWAEMVEYLAPAAPAAASASPPAAPASPEGAVR